MNKLTRTLLCTLAMLSFALPAAADDKPLLGPGGTQRTPTHMDVARSDAQISTCRSGCTMTSSIKTAIDSLCTSASNARACFDKVCQARCK